MLRLDKNSSTLVSICDGIVNVGLGWWNLNMEKIFVSSVAFYSSQIHNKWIYLESVNKACNSDSRNYPDNESSENSIKKWIFKFLI